MIFGDDDCRNFQFRVFIFYSPLALLHPCFRRYLDFWSAPPLMAVTVTLLRVLTFLPPPSCPCARSHPLPPSPHPKAHFLCEWFSRGWRGSTSLLPFPILLLGSLSMCSGLFSVLPSWRSDTLLTPFPPNPSEQRCKSGFLHPVVSKIICVSYSLLCPCSLYRRPPRPTDTCSAGHDFIPIFSTVSAASSFGAFFKRIAW